MTFEELKALDPTDNPATCHGMLVSDRGLHILWLQEQLLALVEACQYKTPTDYSEDLAQRVDTAMVAFNAKLETL